MKKIEETLSCYLLPGLPPPPLEEEPDERLLEPDPDDLELLPLETLLLLELPTELLPPPPLDLVVDGLE